jgi:hypothetical protein
MEMPNYKTYDGDVLTATSPADLVRQLHAGSRAQAPSDAEFMHQYAERVKVQSGAEIRYDSPEHFIADLIKVKRLKAN